MKFLGNVFSTVVGMFVFFIILIVGVGLIAFLFSGDSDAIQVKKNSVIELDLSKVTTDYAGKFHYEDFDYFESNHDGLSDVIKAIQAAKLDGNIKGISILNDKSDLGMAQIKEVRKALENFKKSGKFVFAYSNTYDQKEYYLNSVATTIYLNPVGEMDFKGLATELLFFKDFQDKYGIKMEVIRHGKYKSAVEPFLENKMSAANREQVTSLQNSIWNSMLVDIAISRNISVAKLNEIATGLLARTPEMAKTTRLVDEIAYEDVYHDIIRTKLQVAKDEEYHTISVLDYANAVARTAPENTPDATIAIVYAQGEIGNGEGGVTEIGEGSMRKALQEARIDKNIKAIVLRIDSPGGNALTSDLIWREIEVTKKVKPVVVSMGNVAASGGYYIACNATKIFAEANTITGSIGVFGILPNFSKITSNLGISVAQVSTNENASGYSVFRPLDDKYRLLAQEGVEKTYNTFVSRVASGRKMTFSQVDAVAQGRVWSGVDALKMGLIDKIGGMDEALIYAANLVNTTHYKTRNFPVYERKLEDVLGNLGLPFLKSKASFIKEEIGEENYKIIEQIKRVQAKKGIQAAMPFELNIR